jgi:hypothetical protein
MNRRQFLNNLAVFAGAGALGVSSRAQAQSWDPVEAMKKLPGAAAQAGNLLVGFNAPSAMAVRYLEIKGKDGFERDTLRVSGPVKYYTGASPATKAADEALNKAMKDGKWSSSANKEIIRRTYAGRGSPEDIRLVLRWVDWERGNFQTNMPYAADVYKGNRRSTATLAERNAALQKHFDDHIRLDCNGFAGNYYKANPAVAPRYLGTPLEEISPLNYAISLSGNGAKLLSSISDPLPGNAVVYLGGSHVSVIDQVRPVASREAALAEYASLRGYDPLVPASLPTVKQTLAQETDGPCLVILTVESCNDGAYTGLVTRANILTAAGTAQPDKPPSHQDICSNPDYKSSRVGAIEPEKRTISCTAWAKHPNRPKVPAFRVHNNLTSRDGKGRLVSIVRM